jgi:DNA-binding NarL/FixJ family response regulator
MQKFDSAAGQMVRLAPRERDVLRLAARGRANKEIALELGVAHGTIKAQMRLIFVELGFDTRTQAALWLVCHPEALLGAAVLREPRIPAWLRDAA